MECAPPYILWVDGEGVFDASFKAIGTKLELFIQNGFKLVSLFSLIRDIPNRPLPRYGISYETPKGCNFHFTPSNWLIALAWQEELSQGEEANAAECTTPTPLSSGKGSVR